MPIMECAHDADTDFFLFDAMASLDEKNEKRSVSMNSP